MDKTIFIIRGLPGSGKTTFAKQLTPIVFEADHYFYDENCNYNFTPSKIKDAHQDCQNKVKSAMELNVPKIAVSNTFTQEWEMAPYFELASKYNYSVFTVVVENRHGGKNVHGVPDEKVEIMKNRFEIKL